MNYTRTLPLIAAALALGIAANGASAGSSITVDVGSTTICIGGAACLDKKSKGLRKSTRDHRTKPVVRDHRQTSERRDHRESSTTVRDHRTSSNDGRANEIVKIVPRFDCRDGAVKLYRMGYDAIRAVDCDAPKYAYTAIDGTALLHAQMNAYSGRMTVRFVGLTN